MTEHKTLMIFLNVLLVIGVILSIATIDRGRWITSYLTFLSSGGDAWNNNTQNNHTNESTGTGAKAAPQTKDACVVISQLSTPGWYDTYLLVSQYNHVVHGGNDSSGTAGTQVICGK